MLNFPLGKRFLGQDPEKCVKHPGGGPTRGRDLADGYMGGVGTVKRRLGSLPLRRSLSAMGMAIALVALGAGALAGPAAGTAL